jgi:hypothetical protein
MRLESWSMYFSGDLPAIAQISYFLGSGVHNIYGLVSGKYCQRVIGEQYTVNELSGSSIFKPKLVQSKLCSARIQTIIKIINLFSFAEIK